MAERAAIEGGDKLDFVGVPQKNRHIVETIRNVGYIGVMLNEEDFFNAVVWATNTVDRFETHFKTLGDRVAIPIRELDIFEKPLLVSAYFVLIIYYFRRGNRDIVASLKQRINYVSMFQYMPPEHIQIMRNWDDYMADVKRRLHVGDFSAPDMTSVTGTRDIYDFYMKAISKERAGYIREMRKENGLIED